MTITSIETAQVHAREWLFQTAAPLWISEGLRPDGMFAERIGQDGKAVAMSRRMRVQARQIYSFCAIGALGWEGPWKEVVEQAVNLLLSRGRRADGLFVHLFDDEGQVVNDSLDLYDHAFGLFALAHAAKALNRPEIFDVAEQIQDILDEKWARREGGFWEGELTPCPPYRQNPHMHMFEAFLANFRFSGRMRWRVLADQMAELFRTKFFETGSGAVTEYFDREWNRLPLGEGDVVEPGHCFEWAWLFEVGFDNGEGIPISDRLVRFARANGLSQERKLAINEVRLDGSVKDGDARLWPQTERLKAAIARYNRLGSEVESKEIISAYNGLVQYLKTDVPGVWFDKIRSDGAFVMEQAPASSFYHIVCGLSELLNIAHN